MLRKTKTNEDRLRKQAESIRKIEYTEMAEHEPSESAKRQMQREDVAEFVARKYGIDAVKGEIAGGAETRRE